MKTLNVTVVQVAAGHDIAANLARLERRLTGVENTDLIALPEVFAMRGAPDDYRRDAQTLDGPIMSMIAAMARRKHVWILAGSIIERAGRRVYNTSVLVNRSGRIVTSYRKIHLFEARLEDGRHIRESDSYSPGSQPAMASIEGWKAGLAICYDLRFPELFRRYSKEGASLVLAPSNFTQRTGKDHWEILVRARAIENQCFVVAPGQCGVNESIGVASYGHSMAVGPWGDILGRAGTVESLFTVALDPADLKATRRRIPALRHRVL